jgi:hypothetical protein
MSGAWRQVPRYLNILLSVLNLALFAAGFAILAFWGYTQLRNDAHEKNLERVGNFPTRGRIGRRLETVHERRLHRSTRQPALARVAALGFENRRAPRRFQTRPR